MRKINFSFSTKLTFDDYVHSHSFALRIIPPDTDTQRILSCSLSVTPNVSLKQTVDAFGNNVTTGYIPNEHRFLDFDVKGTAEVDAAQHAKYYMPCYRYPSLFTASSDAIEAFYHGLGKNFKDDIPKRAAYICDMLSDVIAYKKGVTDTAT
nr:transglutaminase family protein [Oscillospiraceae bacterium]